MGARGSKLCLLVECSSIPPEPAYSDRIMHGSERSDGICYLLRMPYGEFHAQKLFRPLWTTDHRMIEIREEIYCQFLLEKRWAPMGGWKTDGRPTPLENSNEDSRYSSFFTKDQRGIDNFLLRTNAESFSHQETSSIEQAGKMAREEDWETEEEVSIEVVKVCKEEGESEETVDIPDKEMESQKNGHLLAPANSTRHDRWTIQKGFVLAILRTCRQIYAEALPLLYSMVEVIITPEEVVDLHVKEEIIKRSADMKRIRPDLLRHFRDPDYKEGIVETLGLASQFDFAAFSRVERIYFYADYNFRLIKDSPSLYIDEDSAICLNDEAELISFMKRTRTVENLVFLLATLPRLFHFRFALGVIVKPRMDLASSENGGEDLDCLRRRLINERATELFIECGILDPLRKLSNVEHFDLEIDTEARGTRIYYSGLMVLRPEHARMARELKEAIEHNWVARKSIR